MPKIKVVGQTVEVGETNGGMEGQTDTTKRIISHALRSKTILVRLSGAQHALGWTM